MKTSGKILLLRQIDQLSALSDLEISNLADNATYLQFKKGDLIFHQGRPATHVYIIDSGTVKLANTAACGKTLIKDIVYNHQLFGENVFTGATNRSSYAESIKVTKLFSVPVTYFKQLVANNPAFAQSIMDIIIQRLELLESRMQNFVFKKAKGRVVDFIIKTGLLKGIKIGVDECLINHGMSHRDIAYLTDTSRQTVARVLGELKRDNIIHFSPRKPGKILIRQFSNYQ